MTLRREFIGLGSSQKPEAGTMAARAEGCTCEPGHMTRPAIERGHRGHILLRIVHQAGDCAVHGYSLPATPNQALNDLVREVLREAPPMFTSDRRMFSACVLIHKGGQLSVSCELPGSKDERAEGEPTYHLVDALAATLVQVLAARATVEEAAAAALEETATSRRAEVDQIEARQADHQRRAHRARAVLRSLGIEPERMEEGSMADEETTPTPIPPAPPELSVEQPPALADALAPLATEEAATAAAESREAVIEARTLRKLQRAQHRRNVVDGVTAVRTARREKERLGWHESSAELARWRDTVLLEGDARTFKVLRELLTLRRVLASAGQAYGVVRWLAGHGEIDTRGGFHLETGAEVERRKRALRALAVAADMHPALRPLVTAVESERERLVAARREKELKAKREQRTRNRRAFELLAELGKHDAAADAEAFDKAMARARAFVEEHQPDTDGADLVPELEDDGIPF